jgi:heme-degrading monooxygenase HmoA
MGFSDRVGVPRRAGHEDDFQRIYGAQGDWARLFLRGEGYVGTELSRDLENPQRYLVFDLWTSREAYERFRQKYAQEYASLDSRCEEMTSRENPLGAFQRIGIGQPHT